VPDVAVLINALDVLIEASRKAIRDEALQPIERRLEQDMAKAFRAEGRAFLRYLDKMSSLPGVLTEDNWTRALSMAQLETRKMFIEAEEQAVTKAIAAGIRVAASEIGLPAGLTEAAPTGDEIATVLGIRFDLKNPRAVQYIDQVGANLVANVDETTRDYIRTVISKGVAEGASYNRIAKLITDRYSEFAVGRPQLHIDSRAHGIAVTEAGQAYSHGSYMVGERLRDAGLEMEKAWNTFGDERMCAACNGNEAAGWIPFDNAFPSGDLRPLAHPYCRCALMMQRVGAGKEEPEAEPVAQGVPRFTSAKEAEEWVSAQGLVSGQVSFKGFDTETAQSIADSLNYSVGLDPRIGRQIRNIGNNRELNRIAREAARAEVEAQVLLPGGAYYRASYSAEARQRTIEYILKRRDIKIMRNAYAQANSVLGGKQTDIYVSYKWAEDAAAFKKSMARDMLSSFHPVGTGTIRGVIDHETAHAWDKLLGIRSDTEIIKLWKAHLPTMTQDLAGYAKKNIGEFIAEGWEEFTTNPTPRPLA